ncbi:TetR/AcrR family transcriptional regulator C-terminal domain-containing protein [Sphaerisporangium sp. NPDC051017]|uniref:TetR/AcrR family transcriptional regulator n=1 Tax=Sphaerisporangium sp. NPDC051017 TaxID=3154636 RepID=UPI00342280D9
MTLDGEKDHSRSHRGLTRAQVIDAALVIIDDQGTGALTMRRLADALGVYPATIYWHAGNRAELVAHVCRHILSSIEVPDVSELSWDEWIRRFAYETRRTFSEHPNLAADFASEIHVSSTGLSVANNLLSVLTRAGFRTEDLVPAYNTVLAGIFGWISAEFATEPAINDADWATAFKHTLSNVDADEMPALHDALPEISNRGFMLRWASGRTAPMGESFEFAMETMIAGLGVMLRKTVSSSAR